MVTVYIIRNEVAVMTKGGVFNHRMGEGSEIWERKSEGVLESYRMICNRWVEGTA
jgi:predicted Rdx family selenoprotein